MTCDEYDKQVQHLSSLALQDAWKSYVWQRVQELDQVPLFAGIKADVLRHVESLKRQQTSGV